MRRENTRARAKHTLGERNRQRSSRCRFG